MKITWYGTASVVLQIGGVTLAFDPFLKDLPKKLKNKELDEGRRLALEGQKTVFITHGHFDHLASVKPLYSQAPCNIYLTKTPYKTLKRLNFPEDSLKEISVGDEVSFGSVRVRAVPGKHVEYIKKEVAASIFKNLKYLHRSIRLGIDYFRYPDNGEIVMFEVEGEGKLVQIMGSAGLRECFYYKTGADLLILPHQGRSDIDEHNKRIVQRLNPKRILLDHYDNSFPPFSADVPVEDFCLRMSDSIPTQRLIEGQTIEI